MRQLLEYFFGYPTRGQAIDSIHSRHLRSMRVISGKVRREKLNCGLDVFCLGNGGGIFLGIVTRETPRQVIGKNHTPHWLKPNYKIVPGNRAIK
jgi:hypothetical protein